jgi:hypothetical protein
MTEAIERLKDLLKWSDRLGSDEITEINYIVELLEKLTSKVTRLEVINHQDQSTFGRVYARHNCEEIELSFQDEGKTLKVFIQKKGVK